jgi:hypothetical protein
LTTRSWGHGPRLRGRFRCISGTVRAAQAFRRGAATKSQAVRVAVRALTREPVDDPLLELSGDIDGLPSALSERFDRHLRETYVAEPQGPYRARRRTTSRKTIRR